MRFVDLFAGIGGFSLGLERAGMRCVGQVEINSFCLAILAHHWPHVTRIGDIKNVKGNEFGAVELICGGVPCQPASYAGKRCGTSDSRWLWPEAFRVVRLYKPTWCIFENVSGLTSLEQGVVFDSLLSALEDCEYEVQSFIIPACAVDAPHRRDRVWIIASLKRKNAADIDGERLKEQWFSTPTKQENGSTERRCRWPSEPRVLRVADGVSNRVDRVRSLGNAVVPQIVEIIGRAIISTNDIHPRPGAGGCSHAGRPHAAGVDSTERLQPRPAGSGC